MDIKQRTKDMRKDIKNRDLEEYLSYGKCTLLLSLDCINIMECIYGWGSCPPEILNIIFCFLDLKALSNCMWVNYQWRSAVEYVVEWRNQWHALLDTFINNHHEFIKKSTLHPRQILRNNQLWHSVRHAKIELSYKYELSNVSNIHIYRDKLIVIDSEGGKYFDINTTKLIMSIPVSQYICLDFNENDHMLLKLISDGLQNTLLLNGKNSRTDFPLNINECSQNTNINLYKMKENNCYLINEKNVIYQLVWKNNTWKVHFLARFYGQTKSICAIHVHRDEVYIVLRSGFILRVNKKTMSLDTFTRLDFTVDHTSYPVMFNECSAVCGVNASKSFQFITYGNTNQILLEFPSLMCAKQHGDLLLLGYENGSVDICIPKQITKQKKRREIHFNIAEFDPHAGTDLTIKTLNVYEGYGYQYLFVVTVSNIYQFMIKYPDFVINKEPELSNMKMC